MAQTQLPGNQIKDGDLRDADIAADAAIAHSKLANVSASPRVLGRKTAGAGAVEELTGSDVTALLDAASESAAGKIEIATAAEIDTGTDSDRAIAPDQFAGSNRAKRIIQLKVFDDATVITTGNGKIKFMIPVELNGMNLVDVEAYVTTVSSSGAPTIAVYNYTDSQDMLSTSITIDQSETSSLTAATPPVINTTYDDVATGDIIGIDVDGAGTGAKGLGVILSFQTP